MSNSGGFDKGGDVVIEVFFGVEFEAFPGEGKGLGGHFEYRLSTH